MKLTSETHPTITAVLTRAGAKGWRIRVYDTAFADGDSRRVADHFRSGGYYAATLEAQRVVYAAQRYHDGQLKSARPYPQA